MAENVTWLLNFYGPNAKMIVWAHNLHIMGITPRMGSWIEQAYGADYVTFGYEFDHGSFNALETLYEDNQPVVSGNMVEYEVDSAPEDSYAYFMHSAGLSQYILDLRDLDLHERGARWLRSAHPLHVVGGTFGPSFSEMSFVPDESHPLALPDIFDFIIFIDETTASTMLVGESE
jgi:erythromycin esterase-like protein